MDSVNNSRTSTYRPNNQPATQSSAANQSQAAPERDAGADAQPTTSNQAEVFAIANQALQQNAPIPVNLPPTEQMADGVSQTAFSQEQSLINPQQAGAANDQIVAQTVAPNAELQTTTSNYNLKLEDVQINNESRERIHSILNASNSNSENFQDVILETIVQTITENLNIMNSNDNDRDTRMLQTIGMELALLVEDIDGVDDSLDELPEIGSNQLHQIISALFPRSET